MTGLVRFLVESIAARLPTPRVIYDREGGSPYLSRYYLTQRPRMPDGSAPFDPHGDPKSGVFWPDGVGLYLHRFHRSDDDGALHNHPWRWSLSLILVGGYSEERRRGTRVERRFVGPGSLNFIRATDFHRVDLVERDAWSLFLAGPKVGSWGFWDRASGITTPWRDFIATKRGNRDFEATPT